MKLTRKEFFQSLLGSGLALLLGSNSGCKNQPAATTESNPYQYDIEQFKRVDLNLITYQEQAPIPCNPVTPKAVAVTSQDEVIVAAQDSIFFLSNENKVNHLFTTDKAIAAIAALTMDVILVAFKEQVVQFNAKGEIRQTWPTLGENAFITSLAVNQTHVAVADYGNKQCWLFNRQGRLKQMITFEVNHHHGSGGFKIPSPYFDVHFGQDGTIWCTHPGMHRIENYSLTGQRLSSWGRFGMDTAGFSGCCNPTHFAILPSGHFITVEKGLVRIKEYTRQGVLQGVVAAPEQFQEGLTGVDLAVNSQGTVYSVDRLKKQIRVFRKRIGQ